MVLKIAILMFNTGFFEFLKKFVDLFYSEISAKISMLKIEKPAELSNKY